MPCEMVSLAFDANFTTKLKERVIHEGLKKKKEKKKKQMCRKIKVVLRDGKKQHDEAQCVILFYFF